MAKSGFRGSETPLMRQWREVKSQHRDALVFFRVGDFYEMFCDDAEEGSRLLGLTLTTRNNGAAGRVPLAGVPAKALDDYLERLVKLGRRVAICEQMEEASSGKKVVRREVVETVTPGTVLSGRLLEAKRNNYVAALVASEEPPPGSVGVAAMDVSTGEMTALTAAPGELEEVLARFEPTEVLVPESDRSLPPPAVVATVRPDWVFDLETARDELVRRYRVQSLDGFGFGPDDGLLIRAAGALLAYVEEIRPGASD